MILFGKEINLELDEKKISIISIGVVVLIAILGAGIVVVPKAFELKAKKTELSIAEGELKKKEAEKESVQARVANKNKRYQESKIYLGELEEKFRKSALKDETELKIAVQKIINNLKLELIETGLSEKVEETPDYEKRYIPYVVEGEFYQIGRFFYYMENSKNWLLTFKGSALNIKKIEKNKKEFINVKFKVGAYIIKRK